MRIYRIKFKSFEDMWVYNDQNVKKHSNSVISRLVSQPTVLWLRNMSGNKKWKKKRFYQVKSHIVVAQQTCNALHNVCSIDICWKGGRTNFGLPPPLRRSKAFIEVAAYFNGTQLHLFIRVSGNWTQIITWSTCFLRDKYFRCDLINSFFSLFITL